MSLKIPSLVYVINRKQHTTYPMRTASMSAFEIIALRNPSGFLSPASVKAIIAIVLVEYALMKLYYIFVYPFLRSPLRYLPTPKVGNFSLDS